MRRGDDEQQLRGPVQRREDSVIQMNEEGRSSFQELLHKVEQQELQRRRNAAAGSAQPLKDNVRGQGQRWTKWRWLQLGVYLWAARLGMVALGGLFPAFFGLFGWISSQQSSSASREHVLVSAGVSVLETADWTRFLKNEFSLLSRWRREQTPHKVTAVPVIAEQTISLLVQSLSLLPPARRPYLKTQPRYSLSLSSTMLSTVPATEDLPVEEEEDSLQRKDEEEEEEEETVASASSALAAADEEETGKYFAYFTEDRHWSSLYERRYEYLSLEQYFRNDSLRFPRYRFFDAFASAERERGEEEETSHYMYLSYPHLWPFLESFAPSLALVAARVQHSASSAGSASLWMSPTNVSAVMHYDLEDNLLLQLAGEKRVLLVSPEGRDFVRPFPSLHPLWRQSSVERLTTAEQALGLREDQEEERKIERELEALKAQQQRKQRRRRGRPTSPHKEEHKQEEEKERKKQDNGASETEQDTLLPSSERAQIWEVTLSAGEMLFIPAGYFHAVESLSDSVSVNLWLASSLSAVHAKLSNVPLPFSPGDTVSQKLSSVAQMMRSLCAQWGEERDCLAREMRHRYHEQLVEKMETTMRSSDAEDSVCEAVYERMCTQQHLQSAELKVANRRAAQLLAAHIEKARLSRPLKTLAVLDYIDDVLVLVLKEKLRPCTMQLLLQQCWENS